MMEYVEGGPVVLTSKAQHKHLSEAIARKFFRDALQVCPCPRLPDRSSRSLCSATSCTESKSYVLSYRLRSR